MRTIGMFHYSEQKQPKQIDKHYTPTGLAARLVSLVPVGQREFVLDPAAGTNLAFYNHFPRNRMKCEIADGSDFLTKPLEYDWAITNPPYHLLWKFIDKASHEARKGFAFLVNIHGINTLTPKRLALLRKRGLHMRRLHVINVKEWMGRYYFYVFSKKSGNVVYTWDEQIWSHSGGQARK